MRSLLAGLIALLPIVQYRLWVAEGGLAEASRLKEQLVKAEAENAELKARNQALTTEVLALQRGTEAVEQRARENLGLIKEDEVYYQFVEDAPKP